MDPFVLILPNSYLLRESFGLEVWTVLSKVLQILEVLYVSVLLKSKIMEWFNSIQKNFTDQLIS